jgi:hypothetical protein
VAAYESRIFGLLAAGRILQNITRASRDARNNIRSGSAALIFLSRKRVWV